MSWEDKFKGNLLQILYRADQPRHPAGSPQGGQFAPAQGAGGGTADEVEAKIQAKEAEIVGNSYETAIILDKEGNELFRVKGTSSSVTFGQGERRRMKDAILTHNHPGTESGFSFPDVNFMLQNDLAEMRVVTDSYSYSIKPGEDVLMSGELVLTYNQVAQANYNRLRTEIIETGYLFDNDIFDTRFLHNTWTEVAYLLGMPYERTSGGKS